MFRLIFKKINYQRLIPAYVFLSVFFATLGIILYWQTPFWGEIFLFILLLAILTVGLFLVFSTRIAYRDGRLDGYQDGIKDGEKKGKTP